MNYNTLAEFAFRGSEKLAQDDPLLYALLTQEYHLQMYSLMMVAASSIADPSVLACEATVLSNVTTEGYPGARFHAGCEVVDQIEQLAIERAKIAFQAQYANVQPHSGTSANQIVIMNTLKPGETLLGLELNAGGHLTHGAKASISGQYFNAVGYGLNAEGFIDYEQVYDLAQRFRPRLIICGASAYPRVIDFSVFRQIADSVGAFLLADISHIAGLVVAGCHPSSIDHAHFTTTSTYKQLYGPRGGLILMGKDYDWPAPDGKRTLAEMVQRAVFPAFQGTPNLHSIAAKARALAMVVSPEFSVLARRIVSTAQALADCFIEKQYRVLTRGTDNHLVLIDTLASNVTGFIAERALEECNIIINKNRIPGDTKSASITSGIRLGTNSLAVRGMDEEAMKICADLIHRVLSALTIQGEREYELDPLVQESVRSRVKELCTSFPIPHYIAPGDAIRAGSMLS